MKSEPIRLTQYSHGKAAAARSHRTCCLASSLKRLIRNRAFPSLLVGHQSRDDAAAVILDDERALLSTTDFFMPIVDDPYNFGRIAAKTPFPTSMRWGRATTRDRYSGLAGQSISTRNCHLVVKGGRDVCRKLGFPLAGGHSIDAPEPLFARSYWPRERTHLKQNDSASAEDLLILTKPLGIGIHTTAEKQGNGLAHQGLATELMCQPIRSERSWPGYRCARTHRRNRFRTGRPPAGDVSRR